MTRSVNETPCSLQFWEMSEFVAIHSWLAVNVCHRNLRALQEAETFGRTDGPLASNPAVREKIAIASAETYKTLRSDMSEIIKTSDWRRARGVGFTEVVFTEQRRTK